MYIDYTKIITDNFKNHTNEETLESIKSEALHERNYIKRNGFTSYVKEHFFGKADEIAYVSSRHHGKNEYEKALLAANIVFDDEKFAEILLKGNFSKDMLETYIKLLNYLKKAIANNRFEKKDEKFQETAEKYTRLLSKHFSLYIGKNSPNIIINKINEILSYKPELLEEKNNTHTK